MRKVLIYRGDLNRNSLGLGREIKIYGVSVNRTLIFLIQNSEFPFLGRVSFTRRCYWVTNIWCYLFLYTLCYYWCHIGLTCWTNCSKIVSNICPLTNIISIGIIGDTLSCLSELRGGYFLFKRTTIWMDIQSTGNVFWMTLIMIDGKPKQFFLKCIDKKTWKILVNGWKHLVITY